MNKWISRVSCKKPTRERATWEAHARSWRVVPGCQFHKCLVRRANHWDTRKALCLKDFKCNFLTFTYIIYTLITHKSMKSHSERKTLDRFFTTHTPIFERESYSSLVRNHCILFSFPLLLPYLERRFVPKHNPHIFRV